MKSPPSVARTQYEPKFWSEGRANLAVDRLLKSIALDTIALVAFNVRKHVGPKY